MAESTSTPIAEAASLLIGAEAIREVAVNFGGTSTEPLWSPAELRQALSEYASNREAWARRILAEPRDSGAS